jgi:catechol 2,3-dioxygenase-like lactoylglutathione lyase family enzyme
MRLTQITLSCPDLDEGWRFYCALGFTPIVDSRPHYARFVFPDGEATLSLDHDETGAHGGVEIGIECEDLDAVHGRLTAQGFGFEHPPVDQRWLWREARLKDPGGHVLLLFQPGQNRLDPPWKLAPGG